MNAVFLHGLDSSSKGTKGVWFRQHFPGMLLPDFRGSLGERMTVLRRLLLNRQDLVLVGSSFGGLMATIFAAERPDKLRRVILLAPALNFPDWEIDLQGQVSVPAHLYIGSRDTVCPPSKVLPVAREIFSELWVHVPDDDHLLHATFEIIDWSDLLAD